MLAVLIDADNLSCDYAERILEWAASKSAHALVQVFGDFNANRCSDWYELARNRGLELIFQPNGGARKNSTDIALTIRAMDLLHEGVVRTFCLASNDRDFIPLAVRLRRSGRQVLIAAETLNDRLRAVSHDALELGPLHAPEKVAPPLIVPQVSEGDRRVLREIIHDLFRANNSRPVLPAIYGSELKKRNLELSRRIGGANMMKRLVAAHVVAVRGTGSTKTLAPLNS